MKKIIIIGLGKTGLSCVRYYASKNADITVMDQNKNPKLLSQFQNEFPQVKYVLGEIPEERLNDADEIVVSPGVPLAHPAIAKQIKKGKSVVGDIELFSREVKKPVIAITGSNGKTTVTTLLGLMLKDAGYKVAVVGNIGEPALDALLKNKAPDFYVMELSSFQLEAIHSLKTKSATVLNVSPDHMDRYKSYEDYIEAKKNIYRHCECPVINLDDKKAWENTVLPTSISFSSTSPKATLRIEKNELFVRDKKLLSCSELTLQGTHHFQNSLAALALAYAAGLDLEPMLPTIKNFSGVKHRCQWVRNIGGVNWYNDSKATNVGATQVALNSLGDLTQGKIILIAGGQGKAADFSVLSELTKKHVKELILLGEDKNKLAAALQDSAPIHFVDSLDEAVKKARGLSRDGDAVLLAPACASFDMFADYAARGDAFIQLVEQLR